MSGTQDALTLSVNGQLYQGWSAIEVTRGIERMSASFRIAVSERWAGQNLPWVILPGSQCTVSISGDLVMTGFVDEYAPAFDPARHEVSITGRSRTCDLVDCSPQLEGGQYSGYALDAIARAVAQPFGVPVVIETDVGGPLADATIERDETAYEFLERLCRLRGVLMTDDAQGRLVLTNTGTTRAAGRLVQGQNIYAARASLSWARRFSIYVVKGQHAIDSFNPAEVQTGLVASAVDPAVTRFRPRVSIAESQLDAGGMQQRARWMAIYAAGQATKATISVRGWRQADGSLWQINQIVPVTCPYLGVDQDLLVAEVSFRIDEEGHRTDLTVAPPEGYTPEPASLPARKSGRSGSGRGAAWNWSGAGGIP
jgi:prophage tail gpP-like protein